MKYEVLYIVAAGQEESFYAETAEKYSQLVTDLGGTVENVDKWGIKKLAYAINHKTEGYYVVMTYTADGTVPAEMERQMRLNDKIIRFLTTTRK